MALPIRTRPGFCLSQFLSHQQASISLWSFSFRGQTGWKPQTQNTNKRAKESSIHQLIVLPKTLHWRILRQCLELWQLPKEKSFLFLNHRRIAVSYLEEMFWMWEGKLNGRVEIFLKKSSQYTCKKWSHFQFITSYSRFEDSHHSHLSVSFIQSAIYNDFYLVDIFKACKTLCVFLTNCKAMGEFTSFLQICFQIIPNQRWNGAFLTKTINIL